MALVLADRVRETTTVTGTGTATLLGAVSGYQSFSAVGNANTTYYVIANQSATEWEVGIGTYTSSGTTLSRDTVLSSSNSGSLVNFSAGTKDVFVDYPAGKAVYENAAGNVDGYPITGGTIDNTTIGATTPSTGVFTTLTATGQTSLGGVAGSESLRVNTSGTAGAYLQLATESPGNSVFSSIGTNAGVAFVTQGTGVFSVNTGASASNTQFRVTHTASAVNYVQVTGAATGSPPAITVQGSDSNVRMNISSKGTESVDILTNNTGTRAARFAHTASAVNYVQVTGAATTGQPTILATGSDSAVGLTFNTKGVGTTRIQSNSISIARFTGTTSAVNYLDLTHSITGQGPVISAQSISDSNTPLVLKSLGTGAIDLAAGSRGVNISNGGTVTAITRTAGGSGYTTAITATISAPTTAGGVQATANAYAGAITTVITTGGTGYTLNDVITVVGGTGTQSQSYIVSGVSGGAITTLTVQNYGQYTALPTSPVSVTGGTGSSATLTLSNWSMTSITITNAGSGYVEQPTVTFSGGGGSGAAAYASVGNIATIKGLYGGGSQIPLQFAGPAGNILQLMESGTTASPTALVIKTGASSAQMYPSLTNSSLALSASGTSGVDFYTGVLSAQQFRIAHTASAVNYVQVTGAATTAAPVISVQGSDTNVAFGITSKGTSAINLLTNGGNQRQVQINHTASAVNYLTLTGSAASSAPVLAVAGTDTNIDLALTTKGAGRVKFGTYTANMALTIQGYIEILDSGGTIRKLAVIA